MNAFRPTDLPLSAAEYKNFFPDIRTMLNWDRFDKEKWPVAYTILTGRGELLELFTFLRSSLGQINGRFLHGLFSRQMPVEEVLEKFSRIPQADQATIAYFRAVYAQSGAPVRLKLPAYRVTAGRHYLLDGNHRCCALAAARVPFTIDLYAICGPLDPDAQSEARRCRSSLLTLGRFRAKTRSS